MSTSSLSALPSAYATSDPTASQEPPRPARKTYGRKRDATPPVDTEGPSLLALFNPTSSPQRTTRPVRESPSKALLSRWSTGDASWKTSLMGLGMDKDDDDEPIDPAEIERELALMRGKARGDKSSPKRVTLPPPTHNVSSGRFQAGTTSLKATSSSSALSAAPSTSPLKSSPPRSSAPVPIARPSSPSPIRPPTRPSGLANLFDTSSDHEGTTTERRNRSITLTSRRSMTPTPGAGADARALQSDPASSESDVEMPISRKSKLKVKKNRLDAFMSDLDNNDQDAQTPTPPRHSSRAGSSPNIVTDFMATLQQSDDEDEEVLARAKAKSSQAALDPVGLFDEENEERDMAVRSGKTKVKGLAKKDLSEMQKDIAKAQREKHFEPFKTESHCLPISAWAMSAAAILRKPGLVKDQGSPMSSPMQVTPLDEITAFTPSSTSRPDVKFKRDGKRQTMVPGTSSPTPIALGLHNPSGSDDDEYAVPKPLKGFMEIVAEERAKAEKAEFIEARRRILAKRKQEHMKALKWTGKGRDNGNSDDELSITPQPQPAVRFADVKPTAGPRTARSVLTNYLDTTGGKHRQVATQFVGKKAVKEEISETMADFAGKTFKHADMRIMNGGSRPAGQKANRDKVITQRDLDAMTLKEHQRQALRIQQKKEQTFGVRKRHLPTREVQDLEAQIEELRAREARRFGEPEEDDEDAEDGDYQGSDEEEDEVEVEAEEVQYSGEEDNGGLDIEKQGEEEESDGATDIEIDADKENDIGTASKDHITVSLEEGSSPIKAQHVVSDQATPRPFREPLSELQVGQADATPQALESTFVDISGFGSGGSPGFSQLFEATQAAGSGEMDAFAGLRDQHAGLLPANALLPQVDISATQIERDNAVIAAEAEGDEGDSFEERPRTQYMNEKGYFTQTKPQPRPAVSAASSRDLLAGSSALFDFVPAEVPEPELSSTQRDTSEGELAGDSTTQQSESPRRQRSPSSTESGDDEAEIDPGQESRPADAFSRLMAADQRHLTKHQKQAKARIRSNLVDEQADESDEDNWMTGGQTKEDDDEEDEDLDAFLPGLVNDEEVSEEERKRQDALVAAKNREILLADDARREAEARKVTEGQYRTKRRGKDFYSDDEDDGSSKSKRWSKKQRRARREWKEDGLDKLDGEENVFMKLYEDDLDSDVESVDEAPSPRAVVQSPVAKTRMSESERREAIHKVAQMNKGDYEEDDIDLDDELGLGRSMDVDDDTDVETQEETQYSVSRMQRTTKITETSTGSKLSIRSTESYQNFVRDESQTTRRVGAIGAASVVYNKKEILPARPGYGNRPYNGKPPTRTGTGSSSSGSILLSKTNRFA